MTDTPKRGEDDGPEVEGHSWGHGLMPESEEQSGPEVEGHGWTPKRDEADAPDAEDDGPDVEGHSWRPKGPSEGWQP